MDTRLSHMDAGRIVALCDEALAILSTYEGRMSIAEVQARSMLAVLRGEFSQQELATDEAGHPLSSLAGSGIYSSHPPFGG